MRPWRNHEIARTRGCTRAFITGIALLTGLGLATSGADGADARESIATPLCSEAVVNTKNCAVIVDRANPITPQPYQLKPGVVVSVHVRKGPLDQITFTPSFSEGASPDVFAAIGQQLFKVVPGLIGGVTLTGPETGHVAISASEVANLTIDLNGPELPPGAVELERKAVQLRADVVAALSPFQKAADDQDALKARLSNWPASDSAKQIAALQVWPGIPLWTTSADGKYEVINRWDQEDKRAFVASAAAAVAAAQTVGALPTRELAAIKKEIDAIDVDSIQQQFVTDQSQCLQDARDDRGTLSHREKCIRERVQQMGLRRQLMDALDALQAEFILGVGAPRHDTAVLEWADRLDVKQTGLQAALTTLEGVQSANSQNAELLSKQMTLMDPQPDFSRCLLFTSSAQDTSSDSATDTCRSFSSDRFNQRHIGFAVPNATIKITPNGAPASDPSATTVTLSWADQRWGLSAGFFVSNLKQRTYAVAPIVVDGTISRDPSSKPYTFVSETATSPTVEPVVMVHYRVASTTFCQPGCSMFFSAGVGSSQNSSGPDLVVGPTFSYRSFLLSLLLNYTHDIKLTKGLYAGEPLSSSPPSSLPTEKYWTAKFAVAVTYLLPLTSGGASGGGK